MMMMVNATPSSTWYDELEEDDAIDVGQACTPRRAAPKHEQKSRDKFHTQSRHARRSAAKLNNPMGPRRKQRKS